MSAPDPMRERGWIRAEYESACAQMHAEMQPIFRELRGIRQSEEDVAWLWAMVAQAAICACFDDVVDSEFSTRRHSAIFTEFIGHRD